MKYQVWTSEGGVSVDLPPIEAGSLDTALDAACERFLADPPAVTDYTSGREAVECINVQDDDGDTASREVRWS